MPLHMYWSYDSFVSNCLGLICAVGCGGPLLASVVKGPICVTVNEDIIKTQVSEFIHISDISQSIAHSCAKCAKTLDIYLAGATATRRAETHGRKFIKRIWALNRIPDILVEIQRMAAQLQ